LVAAKESQDFSLAIENVGRRSKGRMIIATDIAKRALFSLKLSESLHGSDTEAMIESRTVAEENAIGTVHGGVSIGTQAKRSKSFIREDVLLLSSESQVETVPDLEIEQSEVQAKHSASIGPIDEHALFYLMSRGIDEYTGKTLMKRAFLSQLLPFIEDYALKSRFFHLL
jgi:Fe-S cluster assembly scaffold protein SufB